MPGRDGKTIAFRLPDATPTRLDKALAANAPEGLGLSRTRVSKLIRSGAVRRGTSEVVTDPNARCGPGEEWFMDYSEPPVPNARPQDIAIDIVHEDADVLVVDKPAGMAAHPAPGSEDGTLLNAVLHHCGSDGLHDAGDPLRPGIVHRIDKNTTGLLVIAKSRTAHHGLAEQFARHSVERAYVAFCHGKPDPGDPRLRGIGGVELQEHGVVRIETGIARHRTDRKRMAVVASGGRRAITRFRVDRSFSMGDRPVAARVTCWLETGRTHQIRVHLCHVGHAIVGDMVYGGGRRLPTAGAVQRPAVSFASEFPRQALHAATLGFLHPGTGEWLRFESGLPEDLRRLQESLEGL